MRSSFINYSLVLEAFVRMTLLGPTTVALLKENMNFIKYKSEGDIFFPYKSTAVGFKYLVFLLRILI